LPVKLRSFFYSSLHPQDVIAQKCRIQFGRKNPTRLFGRSQNGQKQEGKLLNTANRFYNKTIWLLICAIAHGGSMKRKSMQGSVCPVARSLDIIGDWWSLLIVRDALNGLTRFGEFQKNLGIAKNMLTQRLKQLVEQDILTVRPATDGSAWNEYVLTEKGRALQTVLVALAQWGGDYLYDSDETCSLLVDDELHQPLRKLMLQAQDGRVLTPDEVVAKRPDVVVD